MQERIDSETVHPELSFGPVLLIFTQYPVLCTTYHKCCYLLMNLATLDPSV